MAKSLLGSYLLSEDNPDCEPHKAITLVSAYLVERGLILKRSAFAQSLARRDLAASQLAEVKNKSNEITAVAKLIESLALKGVVVAFDAMNTQKNYCDNSK